jgi:hypothetical protein
VRIDPEIASADPWRMNTRVLSPLILLALSCDPESPSHATSETTASASGSTSPEPTTTPATGADTMAPTTGVDTTAGASGSSTGIPTGSTGLTTGDSTGGPGMAGVYARYEVRDNTGTPVEVWATPTCRWGGDCFVADFEPMAYDCMSVQAVSQQVLGMQFELATGDPEPCYQPYASWNDIFPSFFYFDAACTQPAIIASLDIRAYLVGGTLYYGSREASMVPPALWATDPDGMCNMYSNDNDWAYSAPVPVPPEILGILPDAPYEIAIAY